MNTATVEDKAVKVRPRRPNQNITEIDSANVVHWNSALLGMGYNPGCCSLKGLVSKRITIREDLAGTGRLTGDVDG